MDMTDDKRIALLSQVAVVYDAMLAQHGGTAAGVGWSDRCQQILRFSILTSGFDPDHPLLVNDVGCGYGALYDYLAPRFQMERYVGTDLCEAMVEAASARISHPRARFVQAAEPVAMADWSVASGIFGITPGVEPAQWNAVIAATLDSMARRSLVGYAFNMLQSGSSDDPFIHSDAPEPWLAWCTRHGDVELIEDAGLPDWTIVVRL